MSWDQLAAIEATARQERADWERARPVDCPVDGTPLVDNGRGGLACPHDGWRWTGPRREDGGPC